jgi:hypothetical protein
MLSAADLAAYTAQQVASLADVDVYAVRAEGERRQNAAEKKIASLMKQLEAARRMMADGEVILNAAHREMMNEAA